MKVPHVKWLKWLLAVREELDRPQVGISVFVVSSQGWSLWLTVKNISFLKINSTECILVGSI